MNQIDERQSERPIAALPIRFKGLAGHFMSAEPGAQASDTAVLLVSPWGFEDMSLRKFYREIAEELAILGIANLRFDLPGTGDSSDPADAGTLDSWVLSVNTASDQLQAMTGASKVILLGHGIGGTLATMAVNRLPAVTGLALLAPVVSGRAYLRETALWWKLIAGDLGLGAEATDSSKVTIAGFEMPDQIAAEIRKIKEAALTLERPLQILCVSRPGRDDDCSFAQAQKQSGSEIECFDYTGYDTLVTNPMISRVPTGLAAKVAAWARAKSPVEAPARAAMPVSDVTMSTNTYVESGIRFGSQGHLVGTLCEPVGERKGSPLLIVGTSYDRAAGWGRMGVQMARALAETGVTSLRFDAAGVADSPSLPGDPRQVLYSASHDRDVRQALHELAFRTGSRALVGGRCSGGYHAFKASIDNDECAGVVLINSYAFVWEEGANVDDVLLQIARPLSDYSKRATDIETFRRIMRGEVNLTRAAFNITSQIASRFAERLAPVFGGLVGKNRLASDIHNAFRKLEEQGKPVLLLYGDHDPGLQQFHLAFGPDGKALKKFSNADYQSLGEADHNITEKQVQQRVIADIARMATRAA